MLNNKISFYSSAKDNQGTEITIDEAMLSIKSEKYKSITSYYRNLATGISKENFKKTKFPAVTWSGLFTQRKADKLTEHSGLICIDIDKLEPEKHDSLKKLMKHDDYICFLFTSPSGNGLKLIFKIPPHANEHLQYFEAISSYIKREYGITVDKSGKDICRLCFLCHDHDCHINNNSLIFSDSHSLQGIFTDKQSLDEKAIAPAPKIAKADAAGFTQLETLFDVHEFTSKHIAYIEGQRNRFIYLFAANACRKGFAEADTLQFMHDNYPDREKAEINQSCKNAYHDNNTEFGKYAKKAKNVPAAAKVSPDRKAAKADAKTSLRNNANGENSDSKGNRETKAAAENGRSRETVEAGTQEEGSNRKEVKFWYESVNEKTGKETTHLQYTKFYTFLETQGFANLKVDEQNVELIHVKENIVSPVIINNTRNDLKAYMNQYCKDKKIFSVLEMLHRGQDKYFARKQFVNIGYKQIDFLKDTDEVSYHFHSNCVVECRATGVTVRDYKAGEKALWKAQINPRPFKREQVLLDITLQAGNDKPGFKDQIDCLMNTDVRLKAEMSACEIYQYQNLVSCHPDREVSAEIANKRFLSHASCFGYLINNFKPSDGIAIIGVDHNKAADSTEQNGRTGKGLLSKAIGYVTKRFPVDAQRYDPKDQSVFEGITMDTKVITMDDCGPRFDFRNFFVPITEDFTVRKMYVGYVTIPYEVSPKWYFNTNFTFKGDGASFHARQHVIEFDNFFHEKHRPIEYFKHPLFRGWDEKQWNSFYNYAYECDALYRAIGLVHYEGGNYSERKLSQECPEEFTDIFQDIDENTGEYMIKKHYLNRFFSKSEIVANYNKICEANNMKKPTAKGVFLMMKKFCQTKELGFFQRKANSEEEYWIGTTYPIPLTKTIKEIVPIPEDVLSNNQQKIFN